MTVLQVTGLTKRYPKFTLDQVSFSLGEGRIMGLIGKNGAGKSTTIKAMLDLVCPDGGTIQMFGQDFRRTQRACKQRLGVVLGGVDFYPAKRLKDITAVTQGDFTRRGTRERIGDTWTCLSWTAASGWTSCLPGCG